MLHVSFPPSWIAKVRNYVQLAFLWMASFALVTGIANAANKTTNQIDSLAVNDKNGALEIRISGSTTPTYTAYELFNPPRIRVDMAETEPSQTFSPQVPSETGIKVAAEEIKDISPPLFRIEFTLSQSAPFKTQQEGNDIVLMISKNLDTSTSIATPASPSDYFTINDIKIVTGTEKTTVQLLASAEVQEYSYDVIDNDGTTPARLFIDINNVSGDTLLQEQLVGTALSKIRVAKRGSGLRFVLDSSQPDLFPFSINKISNGLKIVIEEAQQEDLVSNLISQKTSIEKQLPEVKPFEQRASMKTAEQQMQDAFNFSGYGKERITVDFYKIDLHNVFRLFREVSGLNIIVDQGVSGSLTLALDNVPWDFALDIILNLKDLTKVERFNTLIIIPKNKAFTLSKQAENNVTFEADPEVVAQESLVIKHQKTIPQEKIEARQLTAQGKKAEKKENYELAVSLYEQALVKWEKNSKLANKIASIYLVRLRQNAKATYYAKKALAADPNNTAAALNAAIALANMQESKQAIEYFDQSISVELPSKEALLSFAIFSEGQEEYTSALKLLEKYNGLYGRNLHSMIAIARIYDKMGEKEVATKKYEAILFSGFRVPPDLAKYIKNRIALKQTM